MFRTLFSRLCISLLVLVSAACASGGDDSKPAEVGVTFFGPDAGGAAGAVAAGDFNADGEMDVALGAALAAGPGDVREGAGEVHIFLGPFTVGEERDAGGGGADVAIYGAEEGDQLGQRMVAADFNGDGVDDLAIGAPSANERAGAVYVVFGSPQLASTEMDLASTKADVVLKGADPGDLAGQALSSGDIDGDAATDLIVGALMADGPDNTRLDSGEVYVTPGASLADANESSFSSVETIVYGQEDGDWLGETVGAGDVNGDGRDDLVAVATFADGPGNQRDAAGETYVVFSPTGIVDLAVAEPDAKVIGVDAGDQLGHSLAVGDTDGDGGADLWLGAVSADGPENTEDLAGEVVLALSSNLLANGVVDVAAGDEDTLVYGPAKEARLGRSATMADHDGDGKEDLLVSAPIVEQRTGAVYVLKGGSDYPQRASEVAESFMGLETGDVFGTEAFGAPPIFSADLNGDGATDLIISAAQGDGPGNSRSDCGEAYVFFGKG